MEENENKKNTRIFYLTLAVVLAIVTILIIAAVVARQSASDPTIDSSSTDTESQTGPTISETDVLPEFSVPVDGEISFDFSDSVPVFSPTMNDWRTHMGVDVVA
ncbi:MAG: hypothetical protein IKJ00_09370, partial [Clostridia bacterium]|nr:hypothetical protein [Clostridia bacterium]